MYAALMLVSVAGGFYAGQLVGQIPAVKERQICALVQKELQLKPNEYAMEYDPKSNHYLVTALAKEYGLKVSDALPYQIVSLVEY